MNTPPIGTVVFEQVSKRYRLGALGTLRSTVAALARRGRRDDDPHDFWALKDLSFRVEPGDSLGLIGPNGAGKTTTLKLLSNITRPTSGRIQVSGRMSSLIELGAGFHPELSGRENIYLNGAILGLNRREIQQKLDAIIAFSELERFIDTPVKRYSSGMYIRLGFAVAAHVEPDVLLVDEVLAVGDAQFRQKCMARMELLRKSGVTVIFVSHNMHQVRRLCNQALLLMRGEKVFLGDSSEAVSSYERSIHETWNQPVSDLLRQDVPEGILITQIELLDHNGKLVTDLAYNQSLLVRVNYSTRKPITEPIVKMRLLRSDGTVCALVSSHHKPVSGWTFVHSGVFSALLEPIQLATGVYMIEVRIADSTDTVLLASGQSNSIRVLGPSMMHEPDSGVFVPNVNWAQIEVQK